MQNYLCIKHLMVSIPYLQEGDLIYLTAPAKAIEKEYVSFAKSFFEARGFKIRLSKHLLGRYHYFSGTDMERAADMQEGLDDPEIKAIICCRGGYGCVRTLDYLQWASMLRSPKWIVGFSDVTVYHQHLQRYNLPSIHATMALNFQQNTTEALETMLLALTGKSYSIDAPFHACNKTGTAEGELIGGNLSILYSLIGTDEQPDYAGKILVIEDLAEHLYHIDRMFYALSKSGILNKISGLIVGGMTDLEDTDIPFGQTIEEIITGHFTYRNVPIAFSFPIGHIPDNRAVRLGLEARLEVNTEGSRLSM